MDRCCVLDGGAKELERIGPQMPPPLMSTPSANPSFKRNGFGHFSEQATNASPQRNPVTPKPDSSFSDVASRDSTRKFERLLVSQFAELQRTLLEEYARGVRVKQAQPMGSCKILTTEEAGTQTQIDWCWPNQRNSDYNGFGTKSQSTKSRFQSGLTSHGDTPNGEPVKYKSSISKPSKISMKNSQVYNTARRMMDELPAEVLAKVMCKIDRARSEETFVDMNNGCWHMLRRMGKDFFGKLFMNFVVVTNTIVLGFEASSQWIGWFVVDAIYAAIFVAEQLLMLYWEGFRRFNFYSKESSYIGRSQDVLWHWFDLTLAVFSAVDVAFHAVAIWGPDEYVYGETDQPTGNALLLRFARLVRLTRIMRIFKTAIFKDLIMMINGAVGGIRTLGWSLVLITIPVYAFALFLTETVGQEEGVVNKETNFAVAEHFRTVTESMFTGFRCLVLSDCSATDGTPIFAWLTRTHGWGYGVIYCFISVCMSFGLFNVIIAIYVDNTLEAAKKNDQVQRQRRLENQTRLAEHIIDLTRYLWQKLHEQDQDQEGKIGPEFELQKALDMEMDKQFFKKVVEQPEVRALLSDIDVPAEDHRDLFEVCDADGGGVLTIDELVSGIKKLRGAPRRSDIVFVMLRVNTLMAEIQGLKEGVEINQSAHSQSDYSVPSFFAKNTLTSPSFASFT